MKAIARSKRYGRPKRLKIFKKSLHMQRWLLKNPWIKPMCVFNFAAVVIQKIMRGFLARKKLRSKSSTTKRKKSAKTSNKQLDKYLKYLDDVKVGSKGKASWQTGGFSAWCAVQIQALWRMHKWRRRYLARKYLVNQVAAIVLQSFWREVLAKRNVVTQKQQTQRGKRIDCILMIQRCWRAFCCRRIYKYFRELIHHKLRAAPIDLLRSIIPQESSSLDRAAGVHVRFRLGGRMFPPKLYFKIFTHRPLCDVNAFAPRDYTKERPVSDAIVSNNKLGYLDKTTIMKASLKVGARYFNTIVTTTNEEGTRKWYRRDDGNHWRAVASHLLDKVAPAPWFQDPIAETKKVRAFHFDPRYRKEEMSRYRKQRRREWMMKMYKAAMDNKETESGDKYISTKSNLPDEGIPSYIKQPLVAEEKSSIHKRGASVKQQYKEDFEDLLQWSQDLDFENYADYWSNVGISLPSDVPLQDIAKSLARSHK